MRGACSLCSHVIATTVLVDVSEPCVDFARYDKGSLEMLLEKVTTKKQAAHRPRKTAPALQVQPHGDSSEEDEEGEEESDEDLDEI